MQNVLVVLPLTLIVVLIASGLLKLPQADRTLASFEGFGLPTWLRQRWVAIAFPLGEVILGLVILLASGWIAVVALAAALALMLTYLVLVAISVSRGNDVDCNCFGALSTAPLSWRAVVRNSVLVAVASGALADPVASAGVLARLAGFSAADWLWLLAVAVVATVLLVLGSGAVGGSATAGNTAAADDRTAELLTDPEARAVIPADVIYVTPDLEPVRLRNRVVTHRKTTVLFAVRVGCGACGPVLNALDGWSRRLGEDAQVIALTESSAEAVAAQYPDALPFMGYAGAEAWKALGIRSTPSAILLAGDGTIASEPVSGSVQIAEQMEALVESVEASRLATVVAETDLDSA